MEELIPKILLVEDEQRVANVVKRGLEEYSFIVDVAYDGLIGRSMAKESKYDLIILDVNLPIVNGYELCREIRSMNSEVPILMLTAMGASDNKLEGFEAGADDYILKPFDFKELIARIRVFLKRSTLPKEVPTEKKLVVADLEMFLDSKTVKRDGQKIELTSKEYQLLEYFIRNKGVVISRAEIAEKIWEITFNTGTNIIDVYINYLRKKIDKDFDRKLIHTRVGLGYYLSDEEE